MRHWGTWLVGMDTKPLRAVCALVGSRREKEGEDPVGPSLLFLSHSPPQHGETLPPVLTSPHPSDQASVSSWVIKCQTSIVHGYWGHSLNWVYVASWFPGDCWHPPLSWTVSKELCDRSKFHHFKESGNVKSRFGSESYRHEQSSKVFCFWLSEGHRYCPYCIPTVN